MRIGLFGGSFNPVHRHHLNIARAAREALDLDEVWFVPVFRPVHKSGQEMLPFGERYGLLREVLHGDPHLRAVDIEKTLGGPSYTIRLVKHLRHTRPDDEFFLIIGSDSLLDMPNWREHEALMQLVPLAVVVRPGFSPDVEPPRARNMTLIPLREDLVSSTDIRRRLRQGKMKALPLPGRAFPFLIRNNILNCCGDKYATWIHAIRKFSRESPKGLREHMAEVAELSAAFAADFGADPREGFIAGFAHDLFRGLPEKTLRKALRRADIRLTQKEREIPMLAHGAAAAAFLQSLDPPVPPRIFRAVRWHTFPREHGSSLHKALVLADALAPGRTSEFWQRLRSIEAPPQERFRLVLEAKRERAARREEKRFRSPVRA